MWQFTVACVSVLMCTYVCEGMHVHTWKRGDNSHVFSGPAYLRFCFNCICLFLCVDMRIEVRGQLAEADSLLPSSAS